MGQSPQVGGQRSSHLGFSEPCYSRQDSIYRARLCLTELQTTYKETGVFFNRLRLETNGVELVDDALIGGFTDHARMQFNDDAGDGFRELTEVEVGFSTFNVTNEGGWGRRHLLHKRAEASGGNGDLRGGGTGGDDAIFPKFAADVEADLSVFGSRSRLDDLRLDVIERVVEPQHGEGVGIGLNRKMVLHADDLATKETNEANGTAEFKNDVILCETLLDEPALLELVAPLQDVVFHQRREAADVQLHAMKNGTLFGRQREFEMPAGQEFLNDVGKGKRHEIKQLKRGRWCVQQQVRSPGP